MNAVEDLVGDCVSCGTSQSLQQPDYCTACGGPVIMPPPADPVAPPADLQGVWRYVDRLPLDRSTAWLSLGEAHTPLIPASGTGRWCALDRLRLKLEHLNPSGSFKDRAVATGIAHALTNQTDTVVCSSSGNGAGSTAAYAAHAGLRAVVLIPEGAPPGKLSMAQAHGAQVLRVSGDYSNTFAVGRALAYRHGWSNLTTTFLNSVAAEGLKTVGYELADSYSDAPPDWVLVPVGAGPLVHGIVASFEELHNAGQIGHVPRIAAVQASGCAPIVDAYERRTEQVRAWDTVDTQLSAIADPLRGYPGDGAYTLKLIQNSGGVAIAVDDADAEEARRRLAHNEGLLIEPAAAAVLAAAKDLRRGGVIAGDDQVVAMLTGHGIKTLEPASSPAGPIVDDTDAATDLLIPDSPSGGRSGGGRL